MIMPRMPNGFIPTIASYSNDEPGGVLRTEVSGGAPRYAMDFDRGAQPFHITLILDKQQFMVWVAFYHAVIKKGAISFLMTLDSGLGPMDHVVNIQPGSYTATRTETATVVAFVVDTENSAYTLSASDAQGIIDFYNLLGGSSRALIDRLNQFANSDTNVLHQ
jgi:hypothetical protein